jgi:hypothetical protein
MGREWQDDSGDSDDGMLQQLAVAVSKFERTAQRSGETVPDEGRHGLQQRLAEGKTQEGGSQPSVLLVELADGASAALEFQQGDSADDLAGSFITRHRLRAEMRRALVMQMETMLQEGRREAKVDIIDLLPDD